ncbi:hypothetical protein G7Y79_00001g002080 [Physcia stellaris]|nr:hypothetical protein G7Y79_00001g002080 [Physcia stellaris]
MHFVIIGEIGDQIETDNGFRKTEVIYTQKWGEQEVVDSFHWQSPQNNELIIDSGNTYLLSGEMLLKTKGSR